MLGVEIQTIVQIERFRNLYLSTIGSTFTYLMPHLSGYQIPTVQAKHYILAFSKRDSFSVVWQLVSFSGLDVFLIELDENFGLPLMG